jgi:putative DNA methylase
VLALINSRIADRSFGLGFPRLCRDGPQVIGTDERSLWDRALSEIPRLVETPRSQGSSEGVQYRQPDRAEPLPTDAILDLTELLARSIGQPIRGQWHSFFDHHHLTFDAEAGKQQWIGDVNRIFARAGLAYEMTQEGRVLRLVSAPLHEIIATAEFATGDDETDRLLSRAVALISSRGADAHQDALEKLWDAFERIKTLEHTDKKHGSEALLLRAEAANAPRFNQQMEAINTASAREKSIRHGHPSTLHLWWARRPLAAARAVIFAQMVDDPSEYVDVLLGNPETRRAAERELKRRQALYEKLVAEADPGPPPRLEDCAADLERQRLFRLIEQLVTWGNTTNEEVLSRAREETWASWRRACADNAGHPRAAGLFDRHRLPAFHDPFAGGGALPLEAQRLGLEAHASDLNPVAVLINKAMIEIPPRFANRPPVHPGPDRLRHWKGAQGLAEDMRHYGKWMRDEAEKRIGHLYPKVEVTLAMVAEWPDLKPYLGKRLTVIAWLWARTVRSPNPAFAGVEVPLASTFLLSTKAGKEAWVEPVIEGGGYRFTVKVGKPPEAAKAGTKLARKANFRCLMSGTPIAGDYIKAEGQAGRMGARLMAIVADGERGRVYLAPTPEHEAAARQARPEWKPETPLPDDPRNFWTVQYGLTTFGDLFNDRQLVALTTFSDLVGEAMARIRADALAAGLPDDPTPLRDGGTGATAYAEGVAIYLGEIVSKLTAYHYSLGVWRANMGKSSRAFGRQAIAMVWDFPECGPFAEAGGDLAGAVDDAAKVITTLGSWGSGIAHQQAAQLATAGSLRPIISTDTPYYDNVGYADLSDFYYIWLR